MSCSIPKLLFFTGAESAHEFPRLMQIGRMLWAAAWAYVHQANVCVDRMFGEALFHKGFVGKQTTYISKLFRTANSSSGTRATPCQDLRCVACYA